MSKLYLCGITSAGNYDNLFAMIEPVKKYFDGLCFTFHGEQDEGWKYLCENKGVGDIIPAKWCQRHGYSMTHYLWQGPMVTGDYFVQLDSAERLGEEFCRTKLVVLIECMKTNQVAMISNFGKGFIFRYNETLEFRGSPHWYPTNLMGPAINVDLPLTDFWNVRNEQRDEHQWVSHYVKYFLYPAGSNHALLGLEKKGDPNTLFPIREGKRLEFRREMLARGFPLTLDGLKDMFSKPLDNKLKSMINEEKTWQDFYRYFILNDKTVVHSHDDKEMKEI